MRFGLIALSLVAAAIYFGLAHRVLDRMRLTDRQALLFIGLAIAGSFVDIPLGQRTSVNVGGALLPALLAVSLIIRADESREKVRAIAASLVTAGVVFAAGALTGGGRAYPHGGMTPFIDPLWFLGLVAGVSGYLAGRSRRSAFAAGVLGVIGADLAQAVQMALRGLPVEIALGGAGVLDQVAVSAIVAVGLAELVGETREALQGGPEAPGSKDGAESLERDEGADPLIGKGEDDG